MGNPCVTGFSLLIPIYTDINHSIQTLMIVKITHAKKEAVQTTSIRPGERVGPPELFPGAHSQGGAHGGP